jgi:hypothetical protein
MVVRKLLRGRKAVERCRLQDLRHRPVDRKVVIYLDSVFESRI